MLPRGYDKHADPSGPPRNQSRLRTPAGSCRLGAAGTRDQSRETLLPWQSHLVGATLFEIGGDSPDAVLDRPVNAHGVVVQLDQPCLDSPPLRLIRVLLHRPRDLRHASAAVYGSSQCPVGREREGHIGEQSGLHIEPGRFGGTC
jgi:hypothetical protein